MADRYRRIFALEKLLKVEISGEAGAEIYHLLYE